MNKLIIVLLSFIVVTSCNSNKPDIVTISNSSPDVGMKFEEDFRKGKIVEARVYSGGILSSVTYYKDGLDSLKREFYPSGKIKGLRLYKKGKLDGADRLYYENGKIWVYQEMKANKMDGDFRTYYPNGVLEESGRYKMDKKDEDFKFYTEEGNLIKKEYWENGVMKESELYQENKPPIEFELKKEGKKDGEWKVYYGNGQIKEQGMYKDDEKDGLWLYYNESGQLIRKENNSKKSKSNNGGQSSGNNLDEHYTTVKKANKENEEVKYIYFTFMKTDIQIDLDPLTGNLTNLENEYSEMYSISRFTYEKQKSLEFCLTKNYKEWTGKQVLLIVHVYDDRQLMLMNWNDEKGRLFKHAMCSELNQFGIIAQ